MTEARCVETDCRGVAVSQGRCVGHVDEDGLASYVAELLPDGMWDARGATIDETRCLQLVELLASAEFTGDANFSGAQFIGDANFSGAQFTGGANFGAAQFTGGAKFDDAEFSGRAYFGGALFTGGDAIFAQARFSGGDAIFAQAQFPGGDVYFSWAQFTGGDVNFTEAQFTGGNASFGSAQFTGGDVNFRDAQFGGDAKFAGAQFSRTCFLGPLRGLALDLRRAVFEGVVTVHAASSTISASNLRARESFTLAGRGCEITMIGTQFDKPAWVASSADAVTFPSAATQDDDDKPPRLLSVEGTDLSNVTLVGLDLVKR